MHSVITFLFGIGITALISWGIFTSNEAEKEEDW